MKKPGVKIILMQKISLLFVSIMMVTATLCAQSAVNSTAKHRVIIQLSSNDTLAWKGLMNNIRNLKTGWGDSVQIEVVAHGPGVEMLTANKTTQLERIRQYRSMGVDFVVCENTLRERKIPRETIITEAGFVPMGVGELILKQEQGWSYIKAGF
jgi:intracellular sulfur oxidation DsrE/DsrF family protein